MVIFLNQLLIVLMIYTPQTERKYLTHGYNLNIHKLPLKPLPIFIYFLDIINILSLIIIPIDIPTSLAYTQTLINKVPLIQLSRFQQGSIIFL